jgi:hypothetical protein
MKNKYPLAIIALLFSVVTLFSCSKDKIDPAGGSAGSNPALSNKSVLNTPPADLELVAPGALVLQVFPAEAKSIVTVYNEYYNSGPLAVNAIEGILRVDNLEPGIYQVLVKPNNTSFMPSLIENVVVTSDAKTDLGTIILGN